MLCLFLLPILMEINSQTEQVKISKKAEQLKFEELEAKLNGSLSYSSYSVMDSGVEYQVYWKDDVLTGNKEVCVRSGKNSFQSETEVCGTLE